MCDFFSFVTDTSGNQYYFNWKQRKEGCKNNKGQSVYNFDSHSEICSYYNLNCDKVNKYEYNPLTRGFVIDQINTKDKSMQVEKWVNDLDFKKIVEPLIVKEVVHPFEVKNKRVTKKDIDNLKKWASVGASVWDSVRDSVGASAWDSVGASVWASVGASVDASVRASVGASAWDSARDSVRASVGAYISSFFNFKKWKYIDHKEYSSPFQPCIDLWLRGFVPFFDGDVWRLNNHKNIVYMLKNANIKE